MFIMQLRSSAYSITDICLVYLSFYFYVCDKLLYCIIKLQQYIQKTLFFSYFTCVYMIHVHHYASILIWSTNQDISFTSLIHVFIIYCFSSTVYFIVLEMFNLNITRIFVKVFVIILRILNVFRIGSTYFPRVFRINYGLTKM